MSLHVLSKPTYLHHEEKLLTAVSEVAEKFMKKAATELRKKQKNNSQLAECRVSFDGKRK